MGVDRSGVFVGGGREVQGGLEGFLEDSLDGYSSFGGNPEKWWDWRRRLTAFTWLKRRDMEVLP